jgi:hypothetical protein
MQFDSSGGTTKKEKQEIRSVILNQAIFPSEDA